MRRFNDDRAVSPIIGFIIATVLFSASFYYVMDSAIRTDPARDEAVEYTAVAQSLGDIVMSSGRQWYYTGACSSGVLQTAAFSPEKVGEISGGTVAGRFGLGDENCGRSLTDAESKNSLSFEKFRNLYQAKFAADPANDRVDYEEARRSLGLAEQGLDFHIRTWPVLASVREILGTGQKDPLMRPLYIGDYGSTGGDMDAPSAIATILADKVEVTFTVYNNGDVATLFTIVVQIRLADEDITFSVHTPEIIAAGGTGQAKVVLQKSNDWAWRTQGQTQLKEVRYQVWDKAVKRYPATGGSNSYATVSLDAADMLDCGGAACPLRRQVFAEADRAYFQTSAGSATMKVHHSAFDGRGNPVAISDWDMDIIDSTGVVVESFPLAATNVETDFITRSTSNPASPGVYTYRAILKSNAGTEYNRVNLNVVDTAPSAFVSGAAGYVARTSVVKEIGYIDRLIDNFDPYVINNAYDTPQVDYDCPPPLAAGCGDVFPDLRDVMNNDLRIALTDASGNPSISKYTTVFVGSNVDHNAMTSQQAKGTLRDWVFAGGTLIVMGSDDQSVTWLQPIFHASLETGSGGLYTPDADHAALNVPNQLDYLTYGTGPVWSYNAGEGDSFTHVVAQGESGDILGVGNPGAFGLGKVILTSWRAYALTADQSTACPDPPAPLPADTQCQALFMIHNLVSLSYRELYLDYGPSIPVGQPLGAQIRIGSVYHPDLAQLIGVQIQVFVFPGSGV